MSNAYFTQQINLDALFENARQMYAHNELDSAEALLKVIVKHNPQYSPARAMLDAIQPAGAQKHSVNYDERTGMFAVYDGSGTCVKIFASFALAKWYARKKG